MSDILEELQWRGLVAQTTDEAALREALAGGPVTFYCGFDPTAPSLHFGHLVQLITMRHLQRAGHRALCLVGGSTGLIGDPKPTAERTLNTKETVADWVARIQAQVRPFLDFAGDNPATMVNNLDWTAPMSALDFLRDVGQHFRVNAMIKKDAVAARLNSDQGISYTEFSYQVLQGLDFLELFRQHGCTLQTGGVDQWGNLMAGVDLIHRAEHASVHVLTTPLVTKADGTKFGKTEGNAVWLDPDMTSPYAFYQFWINVEDASVIGYLKIFTDRTRDEIDALEKSVAQTPFKREAQKTLAALRMASRPRQRSRRPARHSSARVTQPSWTPAHCMTRPLSCPEERRRRATRWWMPSSPPVSWRAATPPDGSSATAAFRSTTSK